MATLLVSVAVALASTASLYGAEAYYSGGFRKAFRGPFSDFSLWRHS